MNQPGAGSERFPATAFSEGKRAVFGETPVADLPSGIAGSAQNAPVDNEARADPGAKGEEDEVLQGGPRLAHTEIELGKRSRIAVMFDVNGNSRERLLEVLL